MKAKQKLKRETEYNLFMIELGLQTFVESKI